MKGSFKTALIAAAVSGVVSASAAVATTQTFTLGQANHVNAASSVSNVQANATISPVDAPLLTLENKSTTANATPLSLLAAPNHAPLDVNSAVRVPNLNADLLDGINSSGFARARPLTWIAASFNAQCGGECLYWQNYGNGWGTAGYAKDAFGIVHLKGVIQLACSCGFPPVVLSPAFTLPAGYRPAAGATFATLSNNSLARVNVLSDGEIDIPSGFGNVGNWISLDGISFPAG
jgi:hypothetical protein